MKSKSIHPTSIIHPNAKIGKNVSIGPYSIIGENVTLENKVKIGSHVIIEGWTVIKENTRIFPRVIIGTEPQDPKFKGDISLVVIGKNTIIREFVTINRGTFKNDITKVGDNCYLMISSHVGHNVKVGDYVTMANCVALGGDVIIGDYTVIGGLSAIHQEVRIGNNVMIGGCSRIVQDVFPFFLVNGNPAKMYGINTVGLTRNNFSSEERAMLKKAYKIIFRDNLSLKDAINKIKSEFQNNKNIDKIISFSENSKRGFIR